MTWEELVDSLDLPPATREAGPTPTPTAAPAHPVEQEPSLSVSDMLQQTRVEQIPFTREHEAEHKEAIQGEFLRDIETGVMQGLERSFAAIPGTVARAAVGAAKSVAALPPRIISGALNHFTGTDEWVRKLDNSVQWLEGETWVEREVSADWEFAKEALPKFYGDDAGPVIGNILEGGADLMSHLALLYMLPKVSPIPGMAAKGAKGWGAATKAIHANAVRLGLWKFMSTPGTGAERFKTGAMTYAYMNTPMFAGPLGAKLGGGGGMGKVLAVTMDNLLNAGLSTLVAGSYPQAIAEAKQIAEQAGDTDPWAFVKPRHLLKAPTFITTMMSDIVSTLGTSPKAYAPTPGKVAAPPTRGDALVRTIERAGEKAVNEMRTRPAPEIRADIEARMTAGRAQEAGRTAYAQQEYRMGLRRRYDEARARGVAVEEAQKPLMTIEIPQGRALSLREKDKVVNQPANERRFAITEGDKDIGYVVLRAGPGKDTLTMEDIRVGKEPYVGKGTMPLGIEGNRQLLAQISKHYPTAKLVKGVRVGGAKGEKMGTATVKLRPTQAEAAPEVSQPATLETATGLNLPRACKVRSVNGKLVSLPAGPYRVERTGGGRVKLIDGKTVTAFEGNLPKTVHRHLTTDPNIAMGGMEHSPFGGITREDISGGKYTPDVPEGRPEKIEVMGIKKTVVTEKTEMKMDAMIANMIANDGIPQKVIAQELDKVGVADYRYHDKEYFAEEQTVKDGLARLRRHRERLAYDAARQKAYRGRKSEAQFAGQSRVEEGMRFADHKKVTLEKWKSPDNLNEELSAITGEDFYHAYDSMNTRANLAGWETDKVQERMVDSIGKMKWEDFATNEKNCKNVEQFLLSQSNIKEAPAPPKDLTNDQYTAAMTIIRMDKEVTAPKVRLQRFVEAYERHDGNLDKMKKDIPDAPKEELETASSIYEVHGKATCEEWLNDKTWGVKKVYPYLIGGKAKLSMYTPDEMDFGKGYLKTSLGVKMPETDMNIFQRFYVHTNQVLRDYHLEAPVKAYVERFNEHADKVENASQVAASMKSIITEMLGKTPKDWVGTGTMQKFMKNVYRAVFIRPVLGVRNTFQNAAFYPNKAELAAAVIDPALPEKDVRYVEQQVNQMSGLFHDIMFQERVPGVKGKIAAHPAMKAASKGMKIALRWYPFSDKFNRAWCFKARIGGLRKALNNYKNDGNFERFSRRAKLYQYSALQRAEAMDKLVLEGPDAFARYLARMTTDDVHFNYNRHQRSAFEQGSAGRIVASLMTFPRQYTERRAKDFQRLAGKHRNYNERVLAAKDLLTLALWSAAAGNLFSLIAGREKNPYNPANILAWQPGGLVGGSIRTVGQLVNDISTGVITGDPSAKDRAIVGVTRSADMLVPFYEPLNNIIDGLAELEGTDKMFARQIRAAIDEAYSPDLDKYERDRNLVELAQKMFFGAKTGEEIAKRTLPAKRRRKRRRARRRR